MTTHIATVRAGRGAPRSARRPMRPAVLRMGMLAALAGSILALAAGSILPHVVLAIAFLVLAAVHVAGQRAWMRSVARRGARAMKRRTALKVAVDTGGALALGAVMVSGFAAWGGLGAVGGAHGAVAFLLVVATGAHLVLNRRALLAALRRAAGR